MPSHNNFMFEAAGSPTSASPSSRSTILGSNSSGGYSVSSSPELSSASLDAAAAGNGVPAVGGDSPYHPTSPSAANTFPTATSAVKTEVNYDDAGSPSHQRQGGGKMQRSGKNKRAAIVNKPGTSGSKGEEELCLVCGDRASGYHYNALSCEGCKGFFRRSITRGADKSYRCKSGGRCISQMDMWLRRKCQACRLQKCREVGMREECLLSEDQCKARQEKRKPGTSSTAPATPGRPSTPQPASPMNCLVNSPLPSASGPSNLSSCDTRVGSPALVDVSSTNTSTNTSETSSDVGRNGSLTPRSRLPSMAEDLREREGGGVGVISKENWDVLNRIVYYQDRYELPTTEDKARMTQNLGQTWTKTAAVAEELYYRHMVENTILTVQLIVEFSKKVPKFETLIPEDKVILLKGCSLELMILRAARRYEPATGTIVFSDDNPWTSNNFKKVEAGTFVDPMFDFCRQMETVKVNDIEYALLSCLSIFSVREGLQRPSKVEELQEEYALLLQQYEQEHRPDDKNAFARLVCKLPELARISHEHSKMLFTLKFGNTDLPPLLAEIWDMG